MTTVGPFVRADGEGLHFGVTPWRFDDGSADAIASQGERAEALGFDSFWLPESHFTGTGAIPSPLLRLAAVAARTRRLRVGTTSFLLPVRHPIHVAEEVAVLDRLSGGRLILGVGRGFRPALFAAFDVPAREKRARFEAALETMRAAWRGEPVAWEGEGSGRRPVRVEPRPLQDPHPPIWVAAFGPKALEQAGRLGLPYLASPVESMQVLEENHRRHREACDAAAGNGASAGELAVPVMRTVFVSEDRALLGHVRSSLERQAAALLRARPARLREAGRAPVDDWALVGGPDEVAAGIERYRQRLGITHFVFRIQVPECEPEELEASLELLAGLCRQLR